MKGRKSGEIKYLVVIDEESDPILEDARERRQAEVKNFVHSRIIRSKKSQ